MQHDRIVHLLVAGVLGVAAILALSWFFKNFELASREESSGYSQEARRNPLLGAGRFLRRVGVDANSIANTELWRQMPASDDTLVIFRYQPPAGELRRRQLREWVESGGHLIVEADASLQVDEDEEPTEAAGLLAELGVRVREATPDPEEEEGYWARLEVDFAETDGPVIITLPRYHYLADSRDEATARVPFAEGYGLLQYEVGEGLVTVVTDIGFLGNYRIKDHDHALALALLVGVPHQGKVWLMHDVEMPSLLDLAWQHLPHALVAAFTAALLWLWHLGTRLGPLLPPAQAPRRDIGEHLAATATYLWRLDQAQQLYRRNRDQIEQAWLHKHYALRNLTPAERCAWIAARAGLSARAVERALHGEFAGEADFVEMSSCLQVLRSRL